FSGQGEFHPGNRLYQWAKINYVSPYGQKYGDTMETGVALGAGFGPGGKSVAKLLDAVLPASAQQSALASSVALAADDGRQVIKALREGIPQPDGTTRPATDDERGILQDRLFNSIVGVGAGLLAAKGRGEGELKIGIDRSTSQIGQN